MRFTYKGILLDSCDEGFFCPESLKASVVVSLRLKSLLRAGLASNVLKDKGVTMGSVKGLCALGMLLEGAA
jgi:hypothetical protein